MMSFVGMSVDEKRGIFGFQGALPPGGVETPQNPVEPKKTAGQSGRPPGRFIVESDLELAHGSCLPCRDQ
jgi:hypothetical protein